MASQSPNCFFGLEIQPDKKYTQTPPDGVHLHLSQAALPPENNGRVSVKVTIDGKTFCLCTLVAGTIDQSPLDLNFSASQEVVFMTEGDPIIVHLTGCAALSHHSTVLHNMALHCTALHCTAHHILPYCEAVLLCCALCYCVVLLCRARHNTMQHKMAPHKTTPPRHATPPHHEIAEHHTTPHHTTPHHTTPHHTTPHHTTPHHTTPHHTTPHHTTPHHTLQETPNTPWAGLPVPPRPVCPVLRRRRLPMGLKGFSDHPLGWTPRPPQAGRHHARPRAHHQANHQAHRQPCHV